MTRDEGARLSCHGWLRVTLGAVELMRFVSVAGNHIGAVIPPAAAAKAILENVISCVSQVLVGVGQDADGSGRQWSGDVPRTWRC